MIGIGILVSFRSHVMQKQVKNIEVMSHVMGTKAGGKHVSKLFHIHSFCTLSAGSSSSRETRETETVAASSIYLP